MGKTFEDKFEEEYGVDLSTYDEMCVFYRKAVVEAVAEIRKCVNPRVNLDYISNWVNMQANKALNEKYATDQTVYRTDPPLIDLAHNKIYFGVITPVCIAAKDVVATTIEEEYVGVAPTGGVVYTLSVDE